jgi:hypothetical protein
MAKALADQVIPRRFTFHDLRAYYTTHADSKTTAKVYDRSRVSKRRGLR